MEINCAFDYSGFRYYCEVKNSKVPNNVDKVSFIGDHKDEKSNDSVAEIYFYECDIEKIPGNLIKIFPNLTTLYITYSRNLREIRKDDLRCLEKLKEFTILSCNLEFLPCDLFEDMKELEVINFGFNKIKFIGENLLDGLNKLKFVNFYGNTNISLCFNLDNPQTSTTLTDIKDKIREKCAPDYSLEICERPLHEYKKLEENLLDKISELEEKLKISDEFKKNLEDKLEKSEEKLKEKDEKITKWKIFCKFMQERQRKLEESKNIVDDIVNIINNENFKDFKIKIGREEFKVHKIILAARSLTFAMLFAKYPHVEMIYFIDVSVEAFKIFLEFVYNNHLPKNEVNSLEIFMLGGKMKVNTLKEFAAAKLIAEINPENAFEVLKYANKFQHDELIGKSFEEVKKMFPTIKFKDELAKFPEKIQTLIDDKRKMEETFIAAEFEYEVARSKSKNLIRAAEQILQAAKRKKIKLMEDAELKFESSFED